MITSLAGPSKTSISSSWRASSAFFARTNGSKATHDPLRRRSGGARAERRGRVPTRWEVAKLTGEPARQARRADAWAEQFWQRDDRDALVIIAYLTLVGVPPDVGIEPVDLAIRLPADCPIRRWSEARQQAWLEALHTHLAAMPQAVRIGAGQVTRHAAERAAERHGLRLGAAEARAIVDAIALGYAKPLDPARYDSRNGTVAGWVVEAAGGRRVPVLVDVTSGSLVTVLPDTVLDEPGPTAGPAGRSHPPAAR
jgi:hypothetical protein